MGSKTGTINPTFQKNQTMDTESTGTPTGGPTGGPIGGPTGGPTGMQTGAPIDGVRRY
ncbi:hypothetical protein CRE_02396 [Caenorhabditis remanei]|uniref:Uncharacterized protein n=1 Tax=Caenorhabditis remanei TaxID=31234 RepID=E3MIL2_CAERE|nr:hypothetical protein CRE_02396 [Caenorhabditis remanei]